MTLEIQRQSPIDVLRKLKSAYMRQTYAEHAEV